MNAENQSEKLKTESPFLISEEAAEYLRLTPQALGQRIARGRGPKCYRPAGPGSKALFKISDLDAYVESGALEREAKDEATSATIPAV